MQQPIAGPRGRLFFTSDHVKGRWEECVGLPFSDLLHAVKFSRLIGHSPCGKYLAMWYAPEGVFFVACCTGKKTATVMTCLPGWTLTNKRHLALLDSYLVKRHP